MHFLNFFQEFYSEDHLNYVQKSILNGDERFFIPKATLNNLENT